MVMVSGVAFACTSGGAPHAARSTPTTRGARRASRARRRRLKGVSSKPREYLPFGCLLRKGRRRPGECHGTGASFRAASWGRSPANETLRRLQVAHVVLDGELVVVDES